MLEMPKDIRQVEGIVTKLIRLQNSKSGNPRWYVILDGLCTWLTKRDTAAAHMIDVHLLDKPVLLTLENNLIVNIQELTSA